MAMAYPTPAPYILERRQGAVSSVLSDISSVFSSIASTDDSGGDTTAITTTATEGSGGGGGDTTVVVTSTSTPVTSAVTTSTRTRGNRSSTVVVETSTADSGSAGSGGGVVTQVSTQQGGGTVVVERSTKAATSTGTAGSDASKGSSDGGKIGGIVGGVVGGLALITAAILIFFLWRRRRSRTGNGYFLCFGTRPDRNNKDLDVNWPTFDPTLGSAAVGGTMGARSGRNRNTNGHGGTLPNIEDGEDYSPDDDMREVGSNGQGSYGGYYGAGAGAAAIGAAGAASAYSNNAHTHSTSYKGPSEEGHYRNGSQGWGSVPPIGSHNGTDDTAPTYDHLDPPEVREARAREQAEAQAQAHAMYGGSPSPPPMFPSQPAPAYYSSSSPPPNSQRPTSDHRLSVNSHHALPHNMYVDQAPQDEGTLEPQSDPTRMLHLHNPDGY